jgi:hypothetical protein
MSQNHEKRDERRNARLAAALRENLKRRKSQARALQEVETASEASLNSAKNGLAPLSPETTDRPPGKP